MKVVYWSECRTKKKSKNGFEKDFFKLMNNSVFGKTMESIRKHQGITTEKRRNYLIFEPNYHTTNFFSKTVIAIETNEKKTHTNIPE